MNAVYKFYHTVLDGTPVEIGDMNIWDFPWIATGENVEVADPLYAKSYTFPVYQISNGQNTIKFAAGEFSNSIWGIYCPEEEK